MKLLLASHNVSNGLGLIRTSRNAKALFVTKFIHCIQYNEVIKNLNVS